MQDETIKKYETKKALFKSYQVIWYIVYIIEILLLLRIVFRLLGANAGSGFVSFIYGFSQLFVSPFSFIFPSPTAENFTLDTPALVAFIIYPLGAYLLVHLLQLGKPVSPQEVESIEESNIPTP